MNWPGAVIVTEPLAGVLVAYDNESPSGSTALTTTVTTPLDAAGEPTVTDCTVGSELAAAAMAKVWLVSCVCAARAVAASPGSTVLRRAAAHASSRNDTGERGTPGVSVANGFSPAQPIRPTSSCAAGVSAAFSGSGAVGATIAVLSTVTATAVGVDVERVAGAGALAAGADGGVATVALTGSALATRGRSTVLVLVAAGFSEYFDPRSAGPGSLGVRFSGSGSGSRDGVGGTVAVGVGSEVGVGFVGAVGAASSGSASVPVGSDSVFFGSDGLAGAESSGESVELVSDSTDGSATAIPGAEATATPTPSATASAPTRPTYLAYPTGSPRQSVASLSVS